MLKMFILTVCSMFIFSCAHHKRGHGEHHDRKPQSEESRKEKKLNEKRQQKAIFNSIHAR